VIRGCRRKRVAKREKIYRRVAIESGRQRLLDDITSTADPRCTIGVGDSMLRDTSTSTVRRRRPTAALAGHDRTTDKNRHGREREASQRDQDPALKRGERDERAAIGKNALRRCRSPRATPATTGREKQRQLLFFLVASALK
jgi:hypothetical protein